MTTHSPAVFMPKALTTSGMAWPRAKVTAMSRASLVMASGWDSTARPMTPRGVRLTLNMAPMRSGRSSSVPTPSSHAHR